MLAAMTNRQMRTRRAPANRTLESKYRERGQHIERLEREIHQKKLAASRRGPIRPATRRPAMQNRPAPKRRAAPRMMPGHPKGQGRGQTGVPMMKTENAGQPAPIKAGLMAFDAFNDAPILSTNSTGRAVKFSTIAQDSIETQPPSVVNSTPVDQWTGPQIYTTLGDPTGVTMPAYPKDYQRFGASMYLIMPHDTSVLGWKMCRVKGPSTWVGPNKPEKALFTVGVNEIRWPKLNDRLEGTSGNMPQNMKQGKMTVRMRNTSPGLSMGGVVRVLRLVTGIDTQVAGVWCKQATTNRIDMDFIPQGTAYDTFCDFVRTHPKTITYSGSELSESQFINAIISNQAEYLDYKAFGTPQKANDEDIGGDPWYQAQNNLHHFGPGSKAWHRIKGGAKEFVQPAVVGWELNYVGGISNFILYPGTLTIKAVVHTYAQYKLPEAYSVVLEDSQGITQTIKYGKGTSQNLTYGDTLEGYIEQGLITSVNGPLPMEYRISGPDPWNGSLCYDGKLVSDPTNIHQQQALAVNAVEKTLHSTEDPAMSSIVFLFEPMGHQVSDGEGTYHNDDENDYEMTAALQCLTRYSPGHIMNAVATLPPTQPPAVITKLRDAAEHTGSFLEKVGNVASKVISVSKAVAPYIGKALRFLL